MTITLSQRGRVVARAEQIGLGAHPYVFGAAGPDAYDCSGLVVDSWSTVGITLPHNTIEQSKDPQVIVVMPTEQNHALLLPGDLVFFRTDPDHPRQLSHVGVFLFDFKGMRIIGQATDTELGTEVIRMRKYGTEARLGFVNHN